MFRTEKHTSGYVYMLRPMAMPRLTRRYKLEISVTCGSEIGIQTSQVDVSVYIKIYATNEKH